MAQNSTKTARPAGTIQVNNGRHDWQQVDALVSEWQPAVAVVGKISDTDPALKKAANRLLSHLQQQHKVKTIVVDETLTTVSANAILAETDHSSTKRKALRDQVAACLILETWLNSQ